MQPGINDDGGIMKTEIDARGLACPEPVIRTREQMKSSDEIEVLVDNKTAVENLARLAVHLGWSVSNEDEKGYFRVRMKGKPVTVPAGAGDAVVSCGPGGSFITVLSSDEMGSGNSELGAILMKAFIHTLASSDEVPSKILFYNSGVRLAAKGSDVIDDLAVLEQKGSELLVCGTCLNFYRLTDELKAGKVSNMFDILESMKNAGNIIRP